MRRAFRPSALVRWAIPSALILLTLLSTLYAGAGYPPSGVSSLAHLLSGWTFAVPLMAILLAHEFGHFLAGRAHGVDISPPFFIPVPFFLLGTLGAIIRIRRPIRDRNALLDVGVAGPLAGLCVALPVLVYGIAHSPVRSLDTSRGAFILIEGRSLLYSFLLFVIKGPLPEGHDVMLTPTAFAGWAGLLVTMINLLPVAQLDGGHVAYALIGPRQDRFSEYVRRSLPLLALTVGCSYGIPAYLDGKRGADLALEFAAGVHWLVWAFVLWVMTRGGQHKHPKTRPGALSRTRRRVGTLTLLLYPLLFMPAWLRSG